MTWSKSVIFLIFFALVTQVSKSQTIELSKTTIKPDEEFSITLSFPKEVKKDAAFPFPEIPDFVKVQTRFEDDKKLKIYKVIQTYKALKTGKFKLQAFKVKVGEKTISSPGANITVLNTTIKTPIKNPDFQNAEFKSEKEDILLRVSSDKNSVYAGEGFTLTASLVIGENNKTGFNFFDLNNQLLKISRSLATSNCLIDEYSKGMIEQLQFDTIKIDHKLYKRLILFEAKVYPVNSSDITFPSTEFILIKYLTARMQNDILWKAEDLKLSSKVLKIKVKNLPDHPLKDVVPVGAFQMKESISSNKIRTGHSFKYISVISGEGNIAAVLAPEIKESDTFEIFTPEIKQQNFNKSNLRLGQKSFSYSIIPKEPGQYKLSDYFQWVYFDPSKNAYDTLKSKINLTVSGESQKNKEISSTDLGTFYELAGKESNQLRSKEKDQSIKFFANIIILFMLVTTAILIFRR